MSETLLGGIDSFSKETSILNQFLFPAPKSSYTWASFRGKIICVVGREANFVPCMLIPGESTKSTAEKKQHASCLAIYCHANGEDIGILHEAGKWISDHLGVHVMIPEYPGYGMAPGQPNELSVNRNIRAAYEFAVHALQWDPSHILFVGRSIGTGPAVRLAAEVRCGGLILISPYTSVRDMVRRHAGTLTSWLTADLINLFPSEETIPFVRCPLLIVHGSNDKIIPAEHAMKLYSAAQMDDKKLVLIEGLGHHGLDLHLAVAQEAPQLFGLNDNPRALNLDKYLRDSSLHRKSVASPVPVYDVRFKSWSLPAVPPDQSPYLLEEEDRSTEISKKILSDEVFRDHLLGGKHVDAQNVSHHIAPDLDAEKQEGTEFFVTDSSGKVVSTPKLQATPSKLFVY
uniref:Serine aminopeptidase S33 domain-containing protein n=1 Tax=Hanusia phi TaxID=3032 RepID=A0A7S0E134_9CRYP|mmetsp:Transcript_1288/g.2798  ORF Transcript_1288/g.2798 Transcript_1288/m.2798 type:complete len:400 (+) Transcript_1288:71-1270(+)